MTKTQLNQGMIGGLLLVASAVNAQDYPAADFQPKVLYRDESVVVEPVAAGQAPCVSQDSAAKQEVAVAEEVDAKYPASSFQPKVIFSE